MTASDVDESSLGNLSAGRYDFPLCARMEASDGDP